MLSATSPRRLPEDAVVRGVYPFDAVLPCCVQVGQVIRSRAVGFVDAHFLRWSGGGREDSVATPLARRHPLTIC
jgi:hypothetical protein